MWLSNAYRAFGAAALCAVLAFTACVLTSLIRHGTLLRPGAMLMYLLLFGIIGAVGSYRGRLSFTTIFLTMYSILSAIILIIV
jgi:hypothetical protein